MFQRRWVRGAEETKEKSPSLGALRAYCWINQAHAALTRSALFLHQGDSSQKKKIKTCNTGTFVRCKVCAGRDDSTAGVWVCERIFSTWSRCTAAVRVPAVKHRDKHSKTSSTMREHSPASASASASSLCSLQTNGLELVSLITFLSAGNRCCGVTPGWTLAGRNRTPWKSSVQVTAVTSPLCLKRFGENPTERLSVTAWTKLL